MSVIVERKSIKIVINKVLESSPNCCWLCEYVPERIMYGMDNCDIVVVMVNILVGLIFHC